MATSPKVTLGTPTREAGDNSLMKTWATIPSESTHFTCLICLSNGKPSKKSKLSARRHFKNIHPDTEIDEMLYLEEKSIRANAMKISRGIIQESNQELLRKCLCLQIPKRHASFIFLYSNSCNSQFQKNTFRRTTALV